jgi:hypothetical protein
LLDSKNLIDRRAIEVYIDTYSISEALKNDSSKARKLLQFDRCSDHPNCPIKPFIRTPTRTESELPDLLKSIDVFSLETNPETAGQIKIGRRSILFQHSEQTLIERAKRLTDEGTYNWEELDRLKTVLAYTFMMNEGTDNVFVTNDELILENKSNWEKPLGRGNVNIMSLEEAFEFLGLYCRRYHIYHYQPKTVAGFSGWYSALMKSEIPHFNGEGEYTRGLREKLKHLLIALDRTGFGYYRGTDETNLEMAYHFEKGISLIMSIFDILALIADEKHELNIQDSRLISLSNNRTDGEGNQLFLEKLEQENQELQEHIKQNQDFIQLIEEMRNLVIHREGFPKGGFHNSREGIDFNFIRLNESSIGESVENRITSFGDSELQYKPFTKWGVHSMDGFDFVSLEPHHFLKRSVKELVNFTDKFLELCGYENFVQKNWGEGDRSDVDSVKRLRKHSLKFELSQ